MTSTATTMYVVETDDDEVFLGMVEEKNIGTDDHVVVIRNGYAGAPVVRHASEVTALLLAEGHPDVVPV